MTFRVVILATVTTVTLITAASAEPGPRWPYRSEPPLPKPKDGGYLWFDRVVKLRGALTFDHIIASIPERKFASYMLRTAYSYNLTDGRVSIMAVQDFFVQGRRDLLSSQRDH